MAPKRRRSSQEEKDAKKTHFIPLYLRKIPSSNVPGEAPHVAMKDAPSIIPDRNEDKHESRNNLFDMDDVLPIQHPHPGVAAPLAIKIPTMLMLGSNPRFSGLIKSKDVEMKDAEVSGSKELGSKTPSSKKLKKSSVITCSLEEEDKKEEDLANVKFDILPAPKTIAFAARDEPDTLGKEKSENSDYIRNSGSTKLETSSGEVSSFSYDAISVQDDGSKRSRDSILLSAKIFERGAVVRREKDKLEGQADFGFQPELRFGSYPPRPPLHLIFKHDVKKRLDYKDLQHMEFVENWTVYALPETVTEPEEYFERQAFTLSDCKVAINIPLYMFDNPQIDLKYPARDLKEVSDFISQLVVSVCKGVWKAPIIV